MKEKYLRKSGILAIAISLAVISAVGTAWALSDDVFYACEDRGRVAPNSITVNEQAECRRGSPVSWGGGTTTVSFTVKEVVHTVPVGDTTTWVSVSSPSCDPGDQAINGGLYWNNPNQPTISGERTPAGDTGHPVGDHWEATMLQVTPDEASQVDYSDFTVFVVCAG